MTKKIYKETYFQHDRYARQDAKIKGMLSYFRKESEEKAKAAVCVFWWIVEDMHTDDYPVNKLEVFADDYRCSVDFLKSILEDFELFHIENDCYVSNRVLRNLKEQEEKSEKARKSVQKRWDKHKKDTPAEGANTGSPKPLNEYDEDVVLSIIQIYNKKFKKSQIVSNENKARIFKIHAENHLTIEDWEKVFSNAKRGWDIGDKKNVPPNLKKILDEWDSFASDDYFLAPDRDALAEKKKEEERQKEIKAREAELADKKHEEERETAFQAIHDKITAFEYIVKYCPSVMAKTLTKTFLANNPIIKPLAKQYDFTIDEFITYKNNYLTQNENSESEVQDG